MNTPEEIVKGVKDIGEIIACAIAGGSVECLPPALDLVNQILAVLPPIAASSLDPLERAAADKESADREAAKFGK